MPVVWNYSAYNFLRDQDLKAFVFIKCLFFVSEALQIMHSLMTSSYINRILDWKRALNQILHFVFETMLNWQHGVKVF